MTKIFSGVLLFIVLHAAVFAQGFRDPFRFPEENSIVGGIGITTIDDVAYTTFTIAPDIAIGKFGAGLYLQFLLNNENDFKLRTDEFEDGPGIFRVIRYLRYGQKYDNFYARVGSLDRAMLGNGFLMWNYNNASNYDKRRIGLEADVDFNTMGVESVVGAFSSSTVQGYNLFFRPFTIMESGNFILDRLRFYVTYVRDNEVTTALDSSQTLNAFGVGTDLQWLDLPLLKSSVYYDYGKINDYGDGQAVGINVVFPEFIGLMGLAANFEKRFVNEQFVPNLFGPLYELRRQLSGEAGIIGLLENAPGQEGYFGQLSGHILKRMLLRGSFQRLNGVDNSGVLHLEALAPNLVPKFELRATYDKSGIETFSDARTLDAFSLASVEVGYQLNSFLLLTTTYLWYWVEDENGNFKPIERIEPRIAFRYRF